MNAKPAPEETRHGSYGYRKSELQARLGRIEGQVRGITRMVEDEKYCIDILTQISAIRAALDGVAMGVLEDHVKGCVAEAAGTDKGPEHLEELIDVVRRFAALRR